MSVFSTGPFDDVNNIPVEAPITDPNLAPTAYDIRMYKLPEGAPNPYLEGFEHLAAKCTRNPGVRLEHVRDGETRTRKGSYFKFVVGLSATTYFIGIDKVNNIACVGVM